MHLFHDLASSTVIWKKQLAAGLGHVILAASSQRRNKMRHIFSPMPVSLSVHAPFISRQTAAHSVLIRFMTAVVVFHEWTSLLPPLVSIDRASHVCCLLLYLLTLFFQLIRRHSEDCVPFLKCSNSCWTVSVYFS